MKLLLILLTSGFSHVIPVEKNAANMNNSNGSGPSQVLVGNISAVEFKSQKYCRVEADNFEFDVKFKVVSATAYFTGANFTGVASRAFKSNDLSSLKDLMKKCIPGSIVTFD